jgi:branched-chain amino acid transport system permease protein
MAAFSQILRTIFANAIEITRGELGLWGIPTFNVPLLTKHVSNYYVILSVLILSLIIIHKISSSKIGIAFIAIREDEDASSSVGVNIVKVRLIALCLSAFLGGMSGALYAYYVGILVPSYAFGWTIVAATMAMTFFGGPATIYGPVAGAFLLTFLTEYLRFAEVLRFVIYGLIIMVVALFVPEGFIRKAVSTISSAKSE